jgi:hypothetical protein
VADVVSPAPSKSAGESVWSPKDPLAVAFEIRRLCGPNAGAAAAVLVTTAASK